MSHDAGLVVSSAPAVEAPVPFGRLERGTRPLGDVAGGLDVVVGIEQHGWRAVGRRPVGDHGRRTVGNGKDLDVHRAGAAAQVRHGLSRRPDLVGRTWVDLDAGDPDQPLEVCPYRREDTFNSGAKVGHGLGL